MSKKLKVLTVIPARGGSKGVPRKNIRSLCGKPLIYYVIQAAKGCELIDKVIVSTDDDEIAKQALACGAEVPFKRPPEISGDGTSLTPVVKHALKFYDEQGIRFDAAISLQPTSPFITSATLCEAVSKMQTTGCDSVVAVHQIVHGHPFRAKRLIDGDRMENFFPWFNGDVFLQKQDRPPAYAFNGAMYLRKRELLENYIEKDFALGAISRVVIMGQMDSINIDTEEDFRLAEILMKEMRPNG